MKRQNTTTTTVQNLNWSEANQLTIYKCGREVEPGTTTRNKFNEWSERVLNPGSPHLKASVVTSGPTASTTGNDSYTAVSRKVVQKKHKSVRNDAERHYGKLPVWVNEYMTAMLSKTSPRNTCSRYVTDMEIWASFKIQSNDPRHEFVTKG